MRGIAILGSTGSIGRSTLEVLRRQRDHFRLVALVAGQNREALEEQVREWQPAFSGLVFGNGRTGPMSPEVLIEAATRPDVDIVVNAVVGAVGLDATLAALRAGKRVALANKETLVMAGELVARAAEQGGGEVVPVDSEHNAVLQCITGQEPALRRLILTASGGPFRRAAPPAGRLARIWLHPLLGARRDARLGRDGSRRGDPRPSDHGGGGRRRRRPRCDRGR